MMSNLNVTQAYFLQEFCGKLERTEREQGLLVCIVDPTLANVGSSVVQDKISFPPLKLFLEVRSNLKEGCSLIS